MNAAATLEKDRVRLLRADPHRWGAGLIHKIDLERDQTMCGRTPVNCPGTPFFGVQYEITCKLCLRSIDSRIRQAEMAQQYEARAAEREAERQKQEAERQDHNRRWWVAYNAYLASPTWRSKRQRVLERASGKCEGCGERRATQVHHLRYPQGCWPGSKEWIAQEKLFDLRAICDGCHTDVHDR